MPAEGTYLILARVATFYYFLHFIIILPVLGFIEKTDPLPLSISEPVLTGGLHAVTPRLGKSFNDKK